jgi:hypothetical protein
MTDYSSVASELDAVRTESSSALSAHKASYDAELAKLETEYDLHAPAATALLDGLGATELARINEAFAASLATQLQQLTDRGLYSASVAADITARNTRDRNEEVAVLNDRLNREKWENQQRLYEQQAAMRARILEGQDRVHNVEQDVHARHVGQITSRFGLQQSARDRTLAATDRLHAVKQEVYRYQASQITGLYQLQQAMRDRTLNGKTTIYSLREANLRLSADIKAQLYGAGQTIRRHLLDEAARLNQLRQAITQWKATQRDRLLEQVQQIEAQHLAGIDKMHAAQQEVSRVAMAQRDQLLGQLQEAVRGILSGKERYSTLTMQQASTLAEHKHRAIVEKMNEYTARLEGQRGTHAENMKLMAYQLDERNKLLVGLYGFVERREDVGPQWQQLAQVCTALGDAGGGWITP